MRVFLVIPDMGLLFFKCSGHSPESFSGMKVRFFPGVAVLLVAFAQIDTGVSACLPALRTGTTIADMQFVTVRRLNTLLNHFRRTW